MTDTNQKQLGKPDHLWTSIGSLARTQNGELLKTVQAGFKYIETESFESTFQGLFSGFFRERGSVPIISKYNDTVANNRN